MKDFFRPSLTIPTVLFLTAIFLGTFAKPASADTTGFLNLINNYRTQNGVGTLVEDQNLTNAACWLAPDLDINGFNHTDSLGRSMAQRLSDFGVSGSRAENIFYTTSGSSASYAFDSWKNSSGHNTNMLNGVYSRIGIGRASVGNKWYWVTDFANGSAASLTNQCGATVSNPTPPTQPTTTSKPTVQVEETPVNVIEPAPTATISTEPRLGNATKSATLSSRIIQIGSESADVEDPKTLVQGLALGSMFLGNLLLFGFVFWQFFHHFVFQKKNRPN